MRRLATDHLGYGQLFAQRGSRSPSSSTGSSGGMGELLQRGKRIPTQDAAVVVNAGGERAWLGQRFGVTVEVERRKRPRRRAPAQHPTQRRKTIARKQPLGVAAAETAACTSSVAAG